MHVCIYVHTHAYFSFFQLVLRHNRLRLVPKELVRLPQLRELHIQQNQINVLPPLFGRFFSERRRHAGKFSALNFCLGKLDLGNVKHIYRFEPNPFIPELALQANNLARLGNYLKTEEYQEVYQNYFLKFEDKEEVKQVSKKPMKKHRSLSVRK